MISAAGRRRYPRRSPAVVLGYQLRARKITINIACRTQRMCLAWEVDETDLQSAELFKHETAIFELRDALHVFPTCEPPAGEI